MYKDIKIAAIIPARKGSKGIPNKNIIPLNGIPLIEYTLKEAEKVSIIDKIIVSTDSEETTNISRRYRVDLLGLRPKELSNDTAILYDVLKYEIGNHKLIQLNYDVIILLQPTSPLRPSYLIEKALKTFIDKEQQSALSVSEVEEHPIFFRTINTSNRLEKLLEVDSTIRRQDLPKFYKVNGMIYINRLKDIVGGYISFNDNLHPIIIPKEYDIDIDTIEDLEYAERRLNNLREI